MARPRKSSRGASAPREALASASSSAEQLEVKRGAFANFCRNPFCGAGLANRVTKYCEDKPNCQRYRAVVMHCAFRRVLARAGAPLAADKSAPGGAQSGSNGDAAFSIPRRKRKKPSGDDNDEGQQESGADASDAADKRKKKKKKKKAQQTAATGSLTPVSSRSPSPSVVQDAVPMEMRVRQRQIQRHVEVMASSDGQQGDAELAAAAAAVGDAAKPTGGRATTTTAQAVKQMNIELVPLGASNQAVNLAGGGRYVQSGNRTAGPTLPLPPSAAARPPPPSTFRPPLPPKAPSNSVSTAAGAPVAGQTGTATSVVPPQSFTAVPQASRPSSTSASNSALGTGSSSRTQAPPSDSKLPSTTAASTPVADNGSSKPSTMRISASDYLSARKVQEAAAAPPASTGASSAPQASNPSANPPATKRYQPFRDNYRSDSPDFSFSDWDQPTAHESEVPATRSSATTARADYRREPNERSPLARSLSHTDDRSRLPPSPNNRPGYQRSRSDTTAQQSSSHRDDRYVQSSNGDAYRKFGGDYPEDRHRDLTSSRSVDERARVEEYFRMNRDADRRSPRQDRYEDGYRRDRSLPRESSGGSRRPVDVFGREIQHEERDRSAGHSAARSSDASPSSSDAHDRHSRNASSVSSGHGANSSVKSSPFEIEPPQFSYHDKFVSDLVSVFICEIPHAIGAVKNKTKKPRKMKWYLDYVDRVVKLFGPGVSIQIKNNKAVMLVEQCEWLVKEDSSTISLYTRVLHRLLAEALMWRHMREAAEARFKGAKRDFGRNADKGISFIQMWNALKTHNSLEFVPLEKQVRYFCGARKHHWSFSVGNVEIGSGSHEDKRIAFNLATAASMDFLLNLRKPEPERRRWENSSRSRDQDWTSSERSDRDDRDRRREGRPEATDHRRSETLAESNGGGGETVVPAPTAEATSVIAPAISSAVLPTEENVPLIGSNAQDTSGVSRQSVVDETSSQPQSTKSTDSNGVDAATVAGANTSDAPGRPVDPWLHRSPTGPRLRRPSPTDPRTAGPTSNPRTQGPTTKPRAGVASNPTTQGPTTDLRTRVAPSAPRRVPATVSVAAAANGVNGGGSSPAGTSARSIDLSEDEMSISEESDNESSRPAPAKPQPKPPAEAQDTTCHFCAMIRLSKPDAVNTKCFRCQAKAAPGTS